MKCVDLGLLHWNPSRTKTGCLSISSTQHIWRTTPRTVMWLQWHTYFYYMFTHQCPLVPCVGRLLNRFLRQEGKWSWEAGERGGRGWGAVLYRHNDTWPCGFVSCPSQGCFCNSTRQGAQLRQENICFVALEKLRASHLDARGEQTGGERQKRYWDLRFLFFSLLSLLEVILQVTIKNTRDLYIPLTGGKSIIPNTQETEKGRRK